MGNIYFQSEFDKKELLVSIYKNKPFYGGNMTMLHEVFDTPESRMNFLMGCIRLAKCDGVVCEEEQEFIINAANGLQIEDDQQKRLFLLFNDKNNDIKISFENKKQKLLFLKEAICLCYSDGIFKTVEKSTINDIAQELSISTNAVTEINNWVIKGNEWIEQGHQLLNNLE